MRVIVVSRCVIHEIGALDPVPLEHPPQRPFAHCELERRRTYIAGCRPEGFSDGCALGSCYLFSECHLWTILHASCHLLTIGVRSADTRAMPGATYLEPRYEQRWVPCEGGVEIYKRYDETQVYIGARPLWDLTDVLLSSETISSATYTAGGGLGVTATGETTTGCFATIDKTGSVEITVTTSSGRVFQRVFFFRSSDRHESDY